AWKYPLRNTPIDATTSAGSFHFTFELHITACCKPPVRSATCAPGTCAAKFGRWWAMPNECSIVTSELTAKFAAMRGSTPTAVVPETAYTSERTPGTTVIDGVGAISTLK